MFNTNALDINTVSDCLFTLTEQIRCHSCWQKEGKRVRCACGVAACVDCVPCQVCLIDPIPDILLTSRVTNVNRLLHVYANTFNTDVNTRLETLTRMKLERKLFPECIQAPVKYYNKRKTEFGNVSSSRRTTIESLEKRLPHKAVDIFSDNTSENLNMGDSLAHVHEWLDTNAKMTSKSKQRKPLTDFNENCRIAKEQSVSLRNSSIPTVPRKRHLNPPDRKTYPKRSKFDEILPFIDVNENADPKALRCNNHQNPSNYNTPVVPSDGMQFLVTAEIHAPPLIRKTIHRNNGGDGGGGGEGRGSGGSTGSSDKENRDPNLGARRRRGGGGGDDDDHTSHKRRRPLRQTLRSRLRIN